MPAKQGSDVRETGCRDDAAPTHLERAGHQVGATQIDVVDVLQQRLAVLADGPERLPSKS